MRSDEPGAAGDEDPHYARTRGRRIVKMAPPSSFAHVQLPVVRFDESLGDGQAEARSGAGRASTIALEGDIEDAREILGRHTAAGVVHGDVRVVGPLVVDAGLDDDRAVARCVADRVLEQVAQGPQHLGGRHLELRRRTDEPTLEVHALGGRDRCRSRQHVRHEVAERHALEVESQRTRLGPAELEEVVDERREMVDLLAHGAEITLDGRRIVDDAVLERLDDRSHPGQRGSQIVRDPGDELAPRRLEHSLTRPCLVESGLGRGQLVCEIHELGGSVAFERPGRSRVLLAEPARGRDERAARGADPCAEKRRRRGSRRCPPRTRTTTSAPQIVLRDEHRSRCGVAHRR